eukprot:COSAG05_NODE_105_length_18793_cov_115.346421_30_plen_68_part_00
MVVSQPQVVQNPRTLPTQRLRLGLIFALRYEAELEADPEMLDRLKDLLFEVRKTYLRNTFPNPYTTL